MDKKFKLEFEVEKLDRGVMFLHQQLATGETGHKKKFSVDQTLPGNSIIINIGEFADNQRYIVRVESLIKPVIDFHFKEGKNIKVEGLKEKK